MKIIRLFTVVILLVVLGGCNVNNGEDYLVSDPVTELTLPYGGDQPLWYSSDVIGYEYTDTNLNKYDEKITTFESGDTQAFINFHIPNKSMSHVVNVTVLERDMELPLLYFLTSRWIVIGTEDRLVDGFVVCEDAQSTCTVEEVENTVQYGVPGEYYITYQATDMDSNKSEIRTLYVIVSENKSVLSYGQSSIGDIQETNDGLYYLLYVDHSVSVPIFDITHMPVYLVHYVDYEKNMTELELPSDELGNKCNLYTTEVISIYCTKDIENEQSLLIQHSFLLDGTYIGQTTIDTIGKFVFPALTKDGKLYYEEQTETSLLLHLFDCNTMEMHTTTLVDQTNQMSPLSTLDVHHSIGSKIYLYYFVDHPNEPIDFLLLEYDTVTNTTTQYRYDEGHIVHATALMPLDTFTFVMEFSNEGSIETRYFATIENGEITIGEPFPDGYYEAFVVNNTVYFQIQQYRECPDDENRNCVYTTVHIDADTTIELDGTTLLIFPYMHNLERYTYSEVHFGLIRYVVLIEPGDVLIQK